MTSFPLNTHREKGPGPHSLQDKVEEKVKQDRLSKLQEIQKEITLQKNQELEGRVEEVLVEGQSKQSDRDVTGRTRSNKIVNFEGDLGLARRTCSRSNYQSLPSLTERGEAALLNVECGMRIAENKNWPGMNNRYSAF